MRHLAGKRGFTLIELLVVILIIGVLVAVSAPSFLGQTEKAHDSAAKQYLAIAYREAKASSTDRDGDFIQGTFDVSALASAIQSSEPALDVTAGDCPTSTTGDPKHVVVDTTATVGDSIELCNDPTHTVWYLTVTDGQAPVYSSSVEDLVAGDSGGSGSGSGPQTSPAYPVTVEAPQGLVGYWRLDDASGSTMAAYQGHGSDGSYALSPTLGQAGATQDSDAAVAFSGAQTTAQAGLIPGSSDFTGSQFSVDFWYKPTVSGFSYVLAESVSGTSGWRITDLNGPIKFALLSGSEIDVTSTDSFVVNVWHHVVASYDGSSARLYVDGVLENQATAAYTPPAATTAVTLAYSPSKGGYHYSGLLDEFALYGRPLACGASATGDACAASSEIGAQYAAARAVPGSVPASTSYSDAVTSLDPTGYWRLDDSDVNVRAFAQTGPDGYYSGAVSYGQTGATADGDSAVGLSTLSSGTYATIPGRSSFVQPSFSFMIWYLTPANSTGHTTLARDTAAGSGWELVDDSGVPTVWMNNSTATKLVAGPAPTANVWHQVIVTYDGATLDIYVDGVLKATTAASITPAPWNTPLMLAKTGHSYTAYVSGKLDEAAIFGQALGCDTTTVGQACGASSDVGKLYASAG